MIKYLAFSFLLLLTGCNEIKPIKTPMTIQLPEGENYYTTFSASNEIYIITKKYSGYAENESYTIRNIYGDPIVIVKNGKFISKDWKN